MNEVVVFEDPTGVCVTEYRITYTVKNPHHKKYNTADVSFCFDINKNKLKRLDFNIDGKPLFVNLYWGSGKGFVWFFQKKGSYQKASDEEISLMLTVAQDSLIVHKKMSPAFRKMIGLLPKQAEIFSKIFHKETTKTEKDILLKELHKKNKYIKIVQQTFRSLLENSKEKNLGS